MKFFLAYSAKRRAAFLLLASGLAFTFAMGKGGERSPKAEISVLADGKTYTESSFSLNEDFSALNAALVLPAAPEAERVMKAIAGAHPKRVGEALFRNGDWAVNIRGEWFYYADGRILPESKRSEASSYSRIPFYNYSAELPVWKAPSAEESERLREAARSRSTRTTVRPDFFYDALWNIKNRAEAWEQVKTIRFLGREVLVHHAILEEVAMVEQGINKLAASNAEVKRWVSAISSISAWNWRDIADSGARSNHAYGIAIDILPSDSALRGLSTYWLWAQRDGAEWWSLPYSRRYHPPADVIKVFESYGFIWGGKWAFYDTMHFEYRPELILLSGLELSGEY